MKIKTVLLLMLAMLAGLPMVYAGPELQAVTVDFARCAQTIEGFGASDCWSVQFVGKWPESKVSAIADLLFSTQSNPDGSPAGIGLSIWRFNLGGGSIYHRNISDTWHRADCFLDQESGKGGYDWNRCAGQVNLLQAAKARGVGHFVAFVNSPPYSMTKNYRTFCDPSVGTTNLDPTKRDTYAGYLADVLEHFRNEVQIEFTSVSPLNEPQWDWNSNAGGSGMAKQEGCRYSNADIKATVDALAGELKRRDLNTAIDITEAGDIQYLFGQRADRGQQIQYFFSVESPGYLGGKVRSVICGHSYGSDSPARLVADRQTLRKQLDKFKLDYAQTEYCIMGEQTGMDGSGQDLGIDPALWLARVVHFDLTVANAISWSWWLAISPYDYKDGLVYCDKNDTDGNYYQSKMLWALGNFSRFIRPGMKRLVLENADMQLAGKPSDQLLISAFFSPDTGQTVMVFVNSSQSSQPVKLELVNLPVNVKVDKWQRFVTAGNDSSAGNLTLTGELATSETLTIPPRSILTIVSK